MQASLAINKDVGATSNVHTHPANWIHTAKDQTKEPFAKRSNNLVSVFVTILSITHSINITNLFKLIGNGMSRAYDWQMDVVVVSFRIVICIIVCWRMLLLLFMCHSHLCLIFVSKLRPNRVIIFIQILISCVLIHSFVVLFKVTWNYWVNKKYRHYILNTLNIYFKPEHIVYFPWLIECTSLSAFNY